MSRRRVAYVGEFIPELRGWDCPDLDPTQLTEDDDDIVFAMTLSIGEPGHPGCDNFQVIVATPAGLDTKIGRRARRAPPIVVYPYQWKAVMAEVERRLHDCRALNWLGAQERLRRQFHWEYEGM